MDLSAARFVSGFGSASVAPKVVAGDQLARALRLRKRGGARSRGTTVAHGTPDSGTEALSTKVSLTRPTVETRITHISDRLPKRK